MPEPILEQRATRNAEVLREQEAAPLPDGVTNAQLPNPTVAYKILKRTLDICFSLAALILLAPVLACIALAIKLTSRGPVLFRQTRIGQHGKPFNFLKFRTMRMAGDDRLNEYVRMLIAGRKDDFAVYKMRNDPRITRVGGFLRRTSLDELPQLLNVLLGDMSLVGPRAPLRYEVEQYEEWHKLRLACKPGITGLWQVSGRQRTTFDEMVRLDIAYIQHPSILLDLKIILSTPTVVFSNQ